MNAVLEFHDEECELVPSLIRLCERVRLLKKQHHDASETVCTFLQSVCPLHHMHRIVLQVKQLTSRLDEEHRTGLSLEVS